MPPAAMRLLMGPFFSDATFIQNDDAVRVSDRGEPVGDYEGGAPLHGPVHGCLDLPFHFKIKRRRGFIKYKDPWISDHGPCYGDPLALPSAEQVTPFSYFRIVPFGRDSINPAIPALLQRPAGSLQGEFRKTVGDIEGYGSFHKERVLGDNADLFPQFPEVHSPDICPVNKNGTAVRVIEAGDEVNGWTCRLPSPLRRRPAHRGEHQGLFPEDRLSGHIGKADIPEGHAAFQHSQGDRVCRRGRLLRYVEEGENPVSGCKTKLHGADHGCEHPYGLDEKSESSRGMR